MSKEKECEKCKERCSSSCLCDCHTLPKVTFQDVGGLVGRLLTYIDATYSDVQQRKAHKHIVKSIIYNWHHENCKAQFPDEDWFGGIPIDREE